MTEYWELSEHDIARCRFEAELEIGLWEFYDEEVQDPYYTWYEIQHMHPWPCDFSEVTTLGDHRRRWMHTYHRPGCQPKMKKVKRMRRT